LTGGQSSAPIDTSTKRSFEDFKGAGLSDEDLAPVQNDIGRLANVHGQARLRGMKLRNADELLSEAGAILSEKYNIKPARRSPTEYVRDMRVARGFAADQDGTGQVGSRRAPRPASSHDADYIRKLRESRGFHGTRL
jgi:hypothetical protein